MVQVLTTLEFRHTAVSIDHPCPSCSSLPDMVHAYPQRVTFMSQFTLNLNTFMFTQWMNKTLSFET
jgi:hypothetical protein